MNLKIGQLVKFKCGSQPATEEGKFLAARRARNQQEAEYLEDTAYIGEWIDLYAVASIIGFQDTFVLVGDSRYPNEAYRLRPDQIIVVSN